MFDGKYLEWNQKRIKAIIDFYGYQFMVKKTVLDLGCGHADIGGALYRLGAEITAVDARPEHLKIVDKKFPGIKTIKMDLDQGWPFYGKQFDIILDLALLCHLKNYEAHLRAVCASTTHLVLETAVCNSNDPNLCIVMPENKGIYELSANGTGCRPSAASIERILTECGMDFKRMDSSKLNIGENVYDWAQTNSGSTSIHNRRLWFCVKNNSIHQPVNTSINQLIAGPPSATRLPVITRSIPFKLPGPTFVPPLPVTPPPISYTGGYSSDSDEIRESSRRFSVLKPETWQAPVQFTTGGVILCSTIDSSMWFKKIRPLFPNLKPHKLSLSLLKFDRVDAPIDLVMCDIDSIRPGNRIWIDEWVGKTLSEQDVKNLSTANTIITPSLLNVQDILKILPNANVIRVPKLWPALNVGSSVGNYFLYFEKDPKITQALFSCWDASWGHLKVVGSSYKVPHFASYVSDNEDYDVVYKLIAGATAIIDFAPNSYYLSGIQELALAIGMPVITNNNNKGDSELVSCISEITNPNIGNAIRKAVSKRNLHNNSSYNYTIDEAIKKMLR